MLYQDLSHGYQYSFRSDLLGDYDFSWRISSIV